MKLSIECKSIKIDNLIYLDQIQVSWRGKSNLPTFFHLLLLKLMMFFLLLFYRVY